MALPVPHCQTVPETQLVEPGYWEWYLNLLQFVKQKFVKGFWLHRLVICFHWICMISPFNLIFLVQRQIQTIRHDAKS